ncbi:hypothetical protein OHU11_06860 [Streptomyces sp. NBC_00257]|uniref:hypothetical protein n=1 Tax=unclassified Streptomyces TaxID=2593676 RepID=UPI00225AAFBD|nr:MULTISPECIES: hypothetical protein [unclassified Streptomyces]WTB58543.1 hypothetical protein OG832_37970 [Streptomyces sp. NBC_00826]WTH88578.1 hypothetical protein OIC43_05740 [Streptomyces sp. NBC_00825]WTH97307.1 hypothetical protein OHA23_05740 [Streptomyces sp. NBC_00822]MCX4862812.1 hypothetical protein [Streptomyces sp. NBC_00906]MCX4894049.1 hypothetical protein [Streptomyces sp. NBC_00892]
MITESILALTNRLERGGEIMWLRVNGRRALELGFPGNMRAELNSLVPAGKRQPRPASIDHNP